MANQTLVVSVLADTKSFSDNLKAATGVATVALAAIGAAAAVFVGTSIKAAAEAEKVAAQTTAALESTASAAGRTADQISGLATQLSRVTGIDDEAIQSAQNLLLTFTQIKGTNFDAATEAVANLSTAMGTDLNSAAMLVGKALNDPVAGMTALKKAGVQLSDGQKETIRSMVELGDVAGAQKIILAELETQFGGSAEAFGNTFSGSIEKVKNSFGNLQEGIGTGLLPILTVANNTISAFLDRIVDSEAFNTFIANVEAMGQGLLDGTFNMTSITGAVQNGIQSAADWLTNGGIQLLVNGLISGREAFFGAALQVFPSIVEALVTVVPQLVAGVITLITSLVSVLVSSLPQLLQGAITLFLGLVQGVVTILPTLIQQVVGVIPTVIIALVSAIPLLLQGAITLFSSLIEAVVTVIPLLLDQLVTMLPEILTAVIGLIPLLIEAAISLFTSLVNAVPVIIPKLIDAVIKLIPIIIDTLINLIPTLLTAAVDLMLAIVDAIPIIIPALIDAVITLIPAIIGALIGAIPKLLDAGVKLFGGLIDAVGRILPRLLEAGGQLVQGLWDGISNAWNRFMSWWNSRVAGVVNVVKDIFGIRSPSTVFAGIGKNIVAGLEQGLAAPNQLGALVSRIADQVTGNFNVGLALGDGSSLASEISGTRSGAAIQIIQHYPVQQPASETYREAQQLMEAALNV